MSGKVQRWVVWAAAGLLGLASSYLLLFSHFSVWDDEGAMMLTVREYLRGADPYGGMSMPYGPAYYLLEKAIHGWLGVPVTHDAGRLVTLAGWLAAAAIGGWMIWRMTRDLWWSVAGYWGSVLSLLMLRNEPWHPQQFGIVATFGVLFLMGTAGEGDRRRLGAAGFLCGALAMTKVNVGVFALAGVAGTTGVLGAMAFAALPVVLVKAGKSASGTALLLGSVVAMSMLAWAGMVSGKRRGAGVRRLAWLAAGAGVAVVGAVCLMLLDGSQLSEMTDGMIVLPARAAGQFTNGVEYGLDRVGFVGTVGAMGLFPIVILGRKREGWGRRVGRIKAAVGALLVLGMAAKWSGFRYIFGVELAAACSLWLLPLGVEGEERRLGRLGVGMVATAMLLQAYPIAGSQVSLSAAPLLLGALLLLHDGWKESGWDEAVPVGVVAAATLGIGIVGAGTIGGSGWIRNSGLPLAGSGLIRAPRQQAAEYEWVVAQVRKECDVVAGMPGFSSFNIWSGVRPAKGIPGGGWVIWMPESRQREMWADLSGSDRACVVYNGELFDVWDRMNPGVANQAFAVKEIRGGFVEWARKGQFVIMKRDPGRGRAAE